MTKAEMEADIAFLLLRACHAGSCSFSNNRWTGMSSNAIVSVAYGGKQDALPGDRSDWAACVRTFRRLPPHRRTKEVVAALAKAKAAYLENYPRHATAAGRNAQYAEWEANRKPRRKRRAA